MRARTIVGIVTLVVGAWAVLGWVGYATYHAMTPQMLAKIRLANRPLHGGIPPMAPPEPPERPASVPAITDAAYTAYFAKVRAAEKINDPLQRCLAYPDPPGMHWHADTTTAYCRYRTQPIITMAQAKDLVFKGKAAELDKILAGYRDAQLHDPAHAGLLEHTYIALDFECSCTESRPMIDAWMKQLPDSAFALAASGIAHQGEAQRASRAVWNMEHESAEQLRDPAIRSRIQEYKPKAIQARDTALHLARQDLDMAVVRDSAVLPVYSAMIYVGWMSAEPLYIEQAIKRGLTVDPLSFRLRAVAITHWYKAMRSTPDKDAQAREATALIPKNPLLRLIVNDDFGPGYDEDDPSWMVQRALDEGDSYSVIDAAAANTFGQDPKLSAALYSQSLRFVVNDASIPQYRAQMLYAGGEKAWAEAEFDRIIKANPKDTEAHMARALSYARAGEEKRAEGEYAAVLKIDPEDVMSMTQLIDIYSRTNRVDQALATIDRLIKVDPNAPTGYVVRANILIQHNRPDARTAAKYVVDHFADRTDQQPILAKMREYLRTHGDAGSPTPSSPAAAH
ncbi:tetratricopeptide repeat protein [Pinirhizobacter soli]|uniref:tetratricopeptide repeat protein n=1 Tax=Pinirhizobacter soli TaxID=2786953 RepID=UPI00202AB6E7|nr:tetratricopeptide repeat protein [Pinirhizobacter soli]